MANRMFVAVVDDDPIWLSTVGRALSRAGQHVLLIGDPLAAFDEILRERPAVVVLDGSMPGLSGPELAEQLRERLRDECPPLILVSGDLGDLDARALEPFDAAYEKPVTLGHLTTEVRRQARSRKRSGTRIKAGGEMPVPRDGSKSA